MKRSNISIILIILLSLILIAIISFYLSQQNNIANSSQPNQTAVVESISESSSQESSDASSDDSLSENESESSSVSENIISSEIDTTQLSDEETIDNNENDSLFNESIVGSSDFPASTIPAEIDATELQLAIDDYYTQEYSASEQTASQDIIDSGTLSNIQATIQANEDLAPLNVAVDQIVIELNGSNNYVARVIVPMTYSEANNIYSENDIELLTISLTELGNRLVMISYYDEASGDLIPYHLTNRTNPLFTYPSGS